MADVRKAEASRLIWIVPLLLLILFVAVGLPLTLWDGWFPVRKTGTLGEWAAAVGTVGAVAAALWAVVQQSEAQVRREELELRGLLRAIQCELVSNLNASADSFPNSPTVVRVSTRYLDEAHRLHGAVDDDIVQAVHNAEIACLRYNAIAETWDQIVAGTVDGGFGVTKGGMLDPSRERVNEACELALANLKRSTTKDPSSGSKAELQPTDSASS